LTITDAPRLTRQAWHWAALQGAAGIDRHTLEALLGAKPTSTELLDEMILERYLYVSATGKLRTGRPLPRELTILG
jgi:hypothetical protein